MSLPAKALLGLIQFVAPAAISIAYIGLPSDLFAASTPDKAAVDACAGLKKQQFSDVPEAPTHIMSAERDDKIQSCASVRHCKITGYVSPSVGFELLLPDQWSGRFIHMGSGLYGGQTNLASCRLALARGYACITSDMGHRGTFSDGGCAYGNLQAKIDWGYRATHVAALAGKAILTRYYGTAAKRSYFQGCSTGGQQGLQASQIFPWDYDGIIAGAPVVRVADLYVTAVWTERSLAETAGPSYRWRI